MVANLAPCARETFETHRCREEGAVILHHRQSYGLAARIGLDAMGRGRYYVYTSQRRPRL